MAAAFGPEVAELPLLGWCRLMRGQCARSTKVGEHGFTLILPWEDVARVESTLRARGAEHGLVRAPHEAIEACAIQNGFFRAHAFSEINGLSKMHARGLTPVEAGVQWLTSPDKGFVGCTSLQRQQLVGVRERVVMLATRGSVSVGARVAFAGVDVGEVLAIAPGCSPGADQFVIAFVRSSHAHAGIDGFVLSDDATRALARIMTPPLVIDPRDPFTRESASRIALSAHDLAEISSESA
jgi:glycine cleavage system aminomethyltransferase T